MCVLCVYDVWGIYSGEYISQLYIRSRPHVHLIYHPVDALKWGKGEKFPSALWVCDPTQKVQGKCVNLWLFLSF